ncbi:MAG: DUF1992 domain-containing protein [Streptosporangiaceae bacterium]
MTDRKPPEMSFRSWIDQQISEAAERGAFDNLPGAGKPLPSKPDPDGLGWLRDYVRREGVSTDELLPTPLKLRKQVHRLTETVPGMRTEQDVRDAAAELNRQIMEWRRIPIGPPVFVPLVDADALVRTWGDSRPETQTDTPRQTPENSQETARVPSKPRRWWQRDRRKRR